MIKSNIAKHKPFKTVEIPSRYFIRDAQIFSELFPDKNHSIYGSNVYIEIRLFSEFDKRIALLMYPDWKNIIVYTNRQINHSEGKQIINIYLFDKEAIESFEPYEKNSVLQNITLSKEHIFTDEQLGRNKGTIVICENGKKHLFQNTREKNEFLKTVHNPTIIENVCYYQIGEKYVVDIPDLVFHSSKKYVEQFKNQPINLFKNEDDLCHLVNYYNLNSKIKDDSSKYKSAGFFDVTNNGDMKQAYYFLNRDPSGFEHNVRYPVTIDYVTKAWIVKKPVEVGLLKSEVLFLFESDKDIAELPIKE